MSARRLLSSACLLLILGGCARLLPPPREPVAEDARRAIALLIDRWTAFTDLRTLVDLQVERGGEKQQLTGVLLAQGPASLRFEALSPFGAPLLIVVMSEGRFTVYNAATNEATEAPASADTAARVLGLPFEPEHLVAAFAGDAVPPRDIRSAEIVPPDADGPSLDVIGGDHRQRIWMDFTTGVVHQVQITGGRYAARITHHRASDGRPAGFDLTAGEGQVTATARYRDPVVGAGIDPERFRLRLPDGVVRRPLR
ncbi:MAG: hypothetical protein HY216_17550 [Candidatus Rokubacteria bacterium]|nr:hypothetical protein [Candidatus Rokubacteria bacterium]